MNVVFLVYDSRSGSTLLSREITSHVPGVLVTPELRFDMLVRRGERWLANAPTADILELLRQHRWAAKLEFTAPMLEEVVRRHRESIRALIEGVAATLAAHRRQPAPSTVVIKSGMHLRVWRRILTLIPDARFLTIVRDPRAAIASKLATPRPYHPGQPMAWGGTLLAALQWRWYSATARRIGAYGELHTVNYEELLDSHSQVLSGVAAFLGSQLQWGTDRYRIPAAEHAIHGRVLTEGLEHERSSAWRKTLSREDQAVIEFVCGAEMRRRGYDPEQLPGLPASFALLGKAFASSCYLVARQLLRREPSRDLRP